jgi:hypothetical protein
MIIIPSYVSRLHQACNVTYRSAVVCAVECIQLFVASGISSFKKKIGNFLAAL